MVHRLIICLGLAATLAHPHEAEEQTIARVTAEIAHMPDDATLYVRLAALHLERRDWQACLVDLERAERRGGRDLDALRGRALLLGHHAAQAVAVLDAHLESHPGDAAAWIVAARANVAAGHVPAAAKCYERAMQSMAKPEPDHFVECAELLVCAGRDDDALSLLDRAPLLAVTVERAIQIELSRGHHDAALRRLDALIATTPLKEPLLARRASLLAQSGRHEESIREWQSLVRRIAAMPPQARDSHAMSKLTLQAQQALAALRGGFAARSP